MKRTIIWMWMLAAIFMFVSNSLAEIRPKELSVTPFVGGYTFDEDQHLETGPVVGLRLGYDLTSRWGVEGVFDYVATESEKGAGDVNGYLYHLDLLYHLMPQSRFVPFLTAGVGGITLDPDVGGRESNVLFNYGAGAKYFLSEKIALRADFRHILVDDDQTYNNLEYTLGLAFLWGGEKKKPEAKAAVVVPAAPPADSDRDGVPDSRDKCPNTPSGERVDENGCPVDRDRDGVLDRIDRCPDTPAGGKVGKDGCPLDSDKDGVIDSLDQCPDTPAGVTVDQKGCPLDSDQDGVFDSLDRCPGTPEGVAVDKNGCPKDGDGDGVVDSLDKCPETPQGAEVNQEGCPVLKEKVSIELNIEFDTGRAEIKPQHEEQIRKVAEFMKRYPDAAAEIEGHTDNVGAEKGNRDLSQRRAERVRQHLIERHGIDPSRLTAKGYGSSKPITDNKTAAGREKNRRVVATLTATEK